jgi:hypothetical protein
MNQIEYRDESDPESCDLIKFNQNIIMSQFRYMGHSMPYLPTEGCTGKLIVIEGTDGCGRSTQAVLLKEWLEVQQTGRTGDHRREGRPFAASAHLLPDVRD